MGRHASSTERHSDNHRQSGVHVLVFVVLLAAAGYGVFFIVGISPTGDREVPAPNGSHTRTAGAPQTLVVRAVGKDCEIVVRDRSGGVLLDRTITEGTSVQFDEPKLSVELSDAGAVQVYVNGVLRPVGRPGTRAAFTVAKPG
ncbi:DUF4115 domain-containing protein [Spirillospora sp. NPDC047279]|uniref:DUF4115 domain-containing protein n=1 Tax=Spirillospora sp. NPDC047279 TaxID=3155478 RepID=UPI0034102F30